jgi:hypothetical protein
VTASISSIIVVAFLTMYRILVGKRALGHRSSRQPATAGVPGG